VREARLFKYGSGTGTNFIQSARAKARAGGAAASPLPDELSEIGDRSGRRDQVGGTTRPPAKMVIVDTDHPDIEQFID